MCLSLILPQILLWNTDVLSNRVEHWDNLSVSFSSPFFLDASLSDLSLPPTMTDCNPAYYTAAILGIATAIVLGIPFISVPREIACPLDPMHSCFWLYALIFVDPVSSIFFKKIILDEVQQT